jgi:hypothetical protein
MAGKKPKILILVEGEKAEPKLVEQLIKIYEIDAQYEIVSYCTNLYVLYDALFGLNQQFGLDENDEEETYEDLRLLLKRREKDEEKKKIFDAWYSDTWLIFDLDPQDSRYKPEKIRRMVKYFDKSTEEGKGKLYLNYPMVEAFRHIKSIPDDDFEGRVATLEELRAGTYKARVGREGCLHRTINRENKRTIYNAVIKQHLNKAHQLAGGALDHQGSPDQSAILSAQLQLLTENHHVSVLSTCAFFIPDYNPALLA